MSVDVTDLVMKKYFITEKKKQIEYLQKEIDEMQDWLEKKCTHPTTITDRKYHSGGYDYVSSVTVTTKCTLCEKVLSCIDDPKHKGHYG